jgi:hypothetical protein
MFEQEGNSMSRLAFLSMRGICPATVILAAIGLSTASAEIQSGEVRINSIQGTVTYSTDHSTWRAVTPNQVLQSGAELKTAADSSADLVFDYSGTVLRMAPDSVLELAKLDKELAGENTIVETSINIKAGSIVGSQRKLAKPSKFEIVAPGVLATIRGTEYAVGADGKVACFTGAVSVNYDSPRGGSLETMVPAGFSFDRLSGLVMATSPNSLSGYSPAVTAVRACAQSCNGGGNGHIDEPKCPISPVKPPHKPPHKPPPPPHKPPHHDNGHGNDNGHGDDDHGDNGNHGGKGNDR